MIGEWNGLLLKKLNYWIILKSEHGIKRRDIHTCEANKSAEEERFQKYSTVKLNGEYIFQASNTFAEYLFM